MKSAIEAELGVRATCCLHIDSSRYSINTPENRAGSTFSREVRVVSFPMPGRRRVDHLALPVDLINSYESRVFVEIGYVSDSNQNWRGVDLEDVLKRRLHDRLQLLIHPFWWRRQPATMRSKLHALADEIGVDVYEIVTPEQWQLMEEQEAAA
jgi:hypothetical protein